jgi:hypothetical protein
MNRGRALDGFSLAIESNRASRRALVGACEVLELACERFDPVTDRGRFRSVVLGLHLRVKRDRGERPRELTNEPHAAEPRYHQLAIELVRGAQAEVERQPLRREVVRFGRVPPVRRHHDGHHRGTAALDRAGDILEDHLVDGVGPTSPRAGG